MTSNENELNTGWHNDPDDEIPFGGRDEVPFVEDGDSDPDSVIIPVDLPPYDPEQAPIELGKPVNGPVDLELQGIGVRLYERRIKGLVSDALAEASKKGWVHPWIHETNQRVRAYVDGRKEKGLLREEAYTELCDAIHAWYANRIGSLAVTDTEPDE